MSRPDGAAEMVACIMVFCAEAGIDVSSDVVAAWLDSYWVQRFETLDAEARLAGAAASAPAVHDLFGPIVVCEPGRRCGGLACPVCGAH